MFDFEFVIAQCPECGISRYSFSEEDALRKLKTHRCLKYMSDEEFWLNIDRIIKGEEYADREEIQDRVGLVECNTV